MLAYETSDRAEDDGLDGEADTHWFLQAVFLFAVIAGLLIWLL